MQRHYKHPGLPLLLMLERCCACRHIPPGRIHDLRSASVNNGRLACIVVTHDLHCYLRQCAAPLFSHISEFVTSFRSAINDHQRKQHEQAAAAAPEPCSPRADLASPGQVGETDFLDMLQNLPALFPVLCLSHSFAICSLMHAFI